MSDVRISQLNAALPLSGSEYVPITQMGTDGKLHTVYTTPDTLAAYVLERASSSTSNDAIPKVTPTGCVLPYAGDVTSNSLPVGWLVCDGTAVSKTTYAILYAVIGDKFGTASDASLFKLPDLRYRVVMGYNSVSSSETPTFGNWIAGQTLSLGASGGEFNHQLSVNEIPAHTHPITVSSSSTFLHYPGGDVEQQQSGAPDGPRSEMRGVNITASIQAAGGNAYHINMQPYVCMNYIIKY